MIANNEVLFEQYRIALKWEKNVIDIEGEDKSSVTDYFLISC